MATLTLVASLVLVGVALGAANVPAWWIDRGDARAKAADQAVGRSWSACCRPRRSSTSRSS